MRDAWGANCRKRCAGSCSWNRHWRKRANAFGRAYCGLIDGEVKSISADAVDDEQLAPVYPMRVAMKTSRILVGDKWVTLTPGIPETAEVKTGRRRAIEFFLSPLMRYQDEALR